MKTTLTIRQFRTLKFSSFPKSSEAERTDFPSYKTSWGVSPNLYVDDPKVIADYIVGTRGSINGIYLEKLERYLGLDEARDEKFISEEEYIQERVIFFVVFLTPNYQVYFDNTFPANKQSIVKWNFRKVNTYIKIFSNFFKIQR